MNCLNLVPSYQLVADEYYDDSRHPTCVNFGELSTLFLDERLRRLAPYSCKALDVGAGRSILARIFEEQNLPIANVTLLGQSNEMLKHSERWIVLGAKPIVVDARHTGLPDGEFDIIVSSLGDPYNCLNFCNCSRPFGHAGIGRGMPARVRRMASRARRERRRAVSTTERMSA